MCYHAKFGCSALKDVGINTGEPQTLGSTRIPLSSYGSHGWSQDTRPFPTCATVSNFVVLRQSVYTKIERNLKSWGALGAQPPCSRGVGDLRTPLPTWVILPNLVILGHVVWALLRRFAWKFDPCVPPFRVIQGHLNQHITFHSNHGPTRTVSKINDFSWKFLISPTPCTLCPRCRVPLEIGHRHSGLKN